MSWHRENVIWKSADGTWSRGFFDSYPAPQSSYDDPDYDPEWDVEYIFDRFSWVSTGHATEREAERSWRGANPGGYSVYDKPGPDTDWYDDLAATMCEAKTGYYQGPTRLRTINALQADLHEETMRTLNNEAHGRLGEYDENRIADFHQKIRERYQSSTPEQKREYAEAEERFVDDLDQAADRFEERAKGLRLRPGVGRRYQAHLDAAEKMRAIASSTRSRIESKNARTAKKTTAKKVSGGRTREKELGVPTTNGGKFAQAKRSEPQTSLNDGPPF